MDRSTMIRGKVMEALNGFRYNSVTIPVFDEIVNPNTLIPSLGGAQEVYIVMQDQQQYYNAVQTVSNPRFNLNLTIRIVTKWGTTGSKKLCEDIGDAILSLLRDDRGASKLPDIQKVELSISRTITETTQSNLSFSKVLILNFIKNG